MTHRKLFLAGTWVEGEDGPLEVRSPYDGSVVSTVGRAGLAERDHGHRRETPPPA